MMHSGFTYEEAFHMSFRDYRRYAAIFNAWSIPAKQRDGGTRRGTAADAAKIFG